jgi:hypothetical protein
MPGRKIFEAGKELPFPLPAQRPEQNFYRQLKHRPDLSFLYQLTAPCYGPCGQQSIDPVVFFKRWLVGHLENIASDRKLIEPCSLRLDLLYFPGYQLDAPLPGYSTVSRTRQLLPVELLSRFSRAYSACARSQAWRQAIPQSLIRPGSRPTF